MRIKSYFANSVEAAMRQAREDLGADAMLIESHAAPAETRHLGRFEVVFGVLEHGREQTKPKRAVTESTRDDVASELKMLRSQMDELRKLMQPSGEPAPSVSDAEEIRGELIAADIDPDIAASLVETAHTIWQSPVGPAPRPGPAKDALRQLIQDSIRRRVQSSSGIAGNGAVVVFVGPPGAGKTTSIAKVAVRQCLAARRSVRIISVDCERVGSHERLRAYAAVLGIGFTAANSIGELHEALKESRGKNCVLIDTPGFSAAEVDPARDLAKALDRVGEREVHLVVPASMKRSDLSACCDRFEAFKPSRLLFTKLDETDSVGSMISEAMRLDKPLSFVSFGQAVPDDIEEADANTLLSKLFPIKAATAVTAA